MTLAPNTAAAQVRPMPSAARTLFTPLPADDPAAHWRRTARRLRRATAQYPFGARESPAYRSLNPFPSRIFCLYLSIRAARVRDFFALEK